MNVITDKNNPYLKKGSIIFGYELEKITELNEIASLLYEFKHIETGAKHIHISNDDKENSFAVAFKTVPSDSTGVAHILEHTVLCGSAKFNVRDPFFSMIKRSLNTFMNALTASDWTMYPFSTQNKKDYFNLMDVYLDAAFFPALDELSFKQEGHRLEFEDDENSNSEKLVYKGVVYNEMKGAMSSPDQVMVRALQSSLYPSTTYNFNSGGDPKDIPKLTLKKLKAFHQSHYHPSNAFFYTYGNLPVVDTLNFINKNILNKFSSIDPGTKVLSQSRWKNPKKVSSYYPLSKDEDTLKKYQASVAWLLCDITDSFNVLALSVLEHVLLGNAASPLHKALIDSELGSSLSDGTGYDADNKDTMFSCGLKDIEKSSVDKVEKIIFDVLTSLCKNKIDRKLINSAIHQIEFHQKEITNSPYPYGIKLLLRLSGSWFHGGNPSSMLQFDTDLKKLNKELDKGGFLESIIKKMFLDNTHRVLFTLIPDQQMTEKELKRVESELEDIKKNMKDNDLKTIKEDTLRLTALQDADEDVSSLPTLSLKDVPPNIKIINESLEYPDILSKCYNKPTSGIFYFSAVASIKSIPEDLIPLVPFFCIAFSRIGTDKKDYTEVERFLDAYTGGFGFSSHVRTLFDNDGVCYPFAAINGKCLNRNIGNLFAIIEEFISRKDFCDFGRLKTLLLEHKAGIESTIVNNGHKYALSLSSRNFSKSCHIDELWHGISQFQYIKKLTDGFDNSDIVKERLEFITDGFRIIADSIFMQDNLKTALIGDDKSIKKAAVYLESIQNDLKKEFKRSLDKESVLSVQTENFIPSEGWITNSSVSFVGSSFKVVRMEHKDSPSLAVISRLLRSLYLHKEIREKGGAYGGFAVYNMEDGLFSFGSYRDPHIINTLEVYKNAASFIRSGDFKDVDIKEAILQVCSDIDKPETPGPAARKAFYRTIMLLTDDMRKKFKKNLLAVTREDVICTAKKYFSIEQKEKAVVVISNEEKLNEANEKMQAEKMKLNKI